MLKLLFQVPVRINCLGLDKGGSRQCLSSTSEGQPESLLP